MIISARHPLYIPDFRSRLPRWWRKPRLPSIALAMGLLTGGNLSAGGLMHGGGLTKVKQSAGVVAITVLSAKITNDFGGTFDNQIVWTFSEALTSLDGAPFPELDMDAFGNGVYGHPPNTLVSGNGTATWVVRYPQNDRTGVTHWRINSSPSGGHLSTDQASRMTVPQSGTVVGP